MKLMEKFIDNDQFAKHLGIKVYDASDGKARGQMHIERYHINSAGTLHGGAIFALADAVFSAASNSHGTLAMAIDVSISYFRAVKEGTIYAEAEEVSINPKLATYLSTIKDEQGGTIALFKGTVYKKAVPIEEIVK